jgi:hypothetical protein
MRRVFKASRLIGLLALMAGFIAISASAAQAEGFWLNNGVAITANTPINAKSETELVLLTKVGLSKVEILCTEIKLVGANLEVGGTAKGKLHFQSPTGCITKLNGTTAAKCVPHSSGAANGLIETNALDASLRLHILKDAEGHEIGKDELVELLPEGAAAFVDLLLGTGECAIGNLLEITGKLFLKDCKNELLVDKVEHLFEEGSLSAILFGGNLMTLDGSAFWFLAAPNLGHTFAGHV